MASFKTIKLIYNHPINRSNKIQALWRFIKWNIASRLMPYAIIYPLTENSKIIVDRKLTGAVINLYCGLVEFEDMFFALHFLRKGDLFVDVGANIGSFTLLASGEVGSTTIAVEPLPSTFQYLVKNLKINDIEALVTAHNIGLSSQKGVLKFTKLLDTVNRVAREGDIDIMDVPVNTLDNLLQDKNPLLLKIDVEGFEAEVIQGGIETLKKTSLQAIIIELNGLGNNYGYDENKIHSQLLECGFTSCIYEPISRKLTKAGFKGIHNTIYVKDLIFVQERLRTAIPIGVLNKKI